MAVTSLRMNADHITTNAFGVVVINIIVVCSCTLTKISDEEVSGAAACLGT